MSDPRTNPNVEKAVAFFTQAGLSRLLTKVRDKYIEIGHAGGQILLEDSTPNERREIASLLGKPPYRDPKFKVRLVDLDNALRQSGFGCTLPDVLEAFFPDRPLVTRPAQRAAHAVRQADFRSALFSIAPALPEGSQGRFWLLNGSHGQEWLFSRSKNASQEEQERQLKLVRYIASVLDQLPQPDTPERLALFAQRTSSDPHTLDPDRPAGRLFLLALGDLTKDQEQSTMPSRAPVQDRAQALRLYADAGLLVDTLSSSVAVFNLAGALYSGGAPDQLLSAAGKRVLLLPLRQVLEWESALPAQPHIYVFENPQVFEQVISALDPGTPLPTLVCTSGWPSVAALRLLDLLMAQSPANIMHYSGDFDLKGLQIAAHLMARYGGRCHPWRFDPASYAVALQATLKTGLAAAPARASELHLLDALPDVFAPLIAAMQAHSKWAYQEGIAHLLAEDVKKSCACQLT